MERLRALLERPRPVVGKEVETQGKGEQSVATETFVLCDSVGGRRVAR